MKTLLVLDLDGTLTTKDNLVGFTIHTFILGFQLRYIVGLLLFILLKLKLISNTKLKAAYAQFVLKGKKQEMINSEVQTFMKSGRFNKTICQDVKAFLESYIEAEKILITANYDFIAVPIGNLFGITKIISAEPEILDGVYSGRLLNDIPYNTSKLNYYKEYISNKSFGRTIGLGDSEADKPMLFLLDEAYLVIRNTGNKSELKLIKGD